MTNNPARALTLIEVLVVLSVLVIAAGLLLPRLAGNTRSRRIQCVNNLKQVGMAYHLWGNDHDNKFPMQVSVTDGGTMELVPSGLVFPHYLVMSNELSTPKLLICPEDQDRTAAWTFSTNVNDSRRNYYDRIGRGQEWQPMDDNHVSYFVGVDADPVRPGMLLAGDRNLTVDGIPLQHGLASLATRSLVGWSKTMHKNCGNVVFADGSVWQFSAAKLREALAKTGVATNRLAIP